MLINAVWFVAGVIALVFGAEVMVRGSANMATRLGIRPIVVGLTVVSIGTSMPELAVGVVSAAEGSGALAVGTIAGTNVVNLMLILGLSALVRPLAIEMRTLHLELPVMAAAAVLFWALAANGELSRLDGVALAVGAIVYTVVVVRASRRESHQVAAEFALAYSEDTIPDSKPPDDRHIARSVGMTLGGIVIVLVGAEWLVDAAVAMARGFRVSDALIGLTIVAIGTSAPEIVTTVVSTLRGERDIGVGNLLGSTIYNILLVLGVTCLVPAHGLALPPALVQVDIPVMVAATLVCIPIFIHGRKVHRVEGGTMVTAYLVYLMFLLAAQT